MFYSKIRACAIAADTQVEKGIPVYIGEMGCVHRNNNRSEAFRKYYLEYVCKAARTNGMAVFYWDNGNAGAGRECSGLMNHTTGTYVNNGKDVRDCRTFIVERYCIGFLMYMKGHWRNTLWS